MSNTKKYYPLDVWESVLKEDGFSFIDERVGWQNDSNCLIYSKINKNNTSLNRAFEAKIWFNRKTELVTYISLEIMQQTYSDHVSVEEFIEFHHDKFRHYLIEKITN